MISPEPIVGNDFAEEAEAFIHSVRGHVLIQRLVVPGHDNENTDDNGNDVEYEDVNDDRDDCSSNNV